MATRIEVDGGHLLLDQGIQAGQATGALQVREGFAVASVHLDATKLRALSAGAAALADAMDPPATKPGPSPSPAPPAKP